jgi:hypothetical protein
MSLEFQGKAIELLKLLEKYNALTILPIARETDMINEMADMLMKWSEQDIDEGMEIVMDSPGDYIDMESFIDESRE